jgi:hypothetical protein
VVRRSPPHPRRRQSPPTEGGDAGAAAGTAAAWPVMAEARKAEPCRARYISGYTTVSP